MAKKRVIRRDELNHILAFDGHVYDEGAGWIYGKLISVTIWGLVLAALALAVINAGFDLTKLPPFVYYLFLIAVVAFGIPSVFIFSTAFFLKQGQVRLLKESFVEVYDRKIVYNRCRRLTGVTPTFQKLLIEEIRAVEVTRRWFELTAKVLDEDTGVRTESVKIPVAFKDMEKVRQMARYR